VAHETAHINLDEHTSITSAHGTITVDSTGSSEHKTDADSAIFRDGTGAISIALTIDFANITTQVDGHLTAADPVPTALPFDATQTNAASEHTLSQLGTVTFASSHVTDGGGPDHNLVLVGTGLSAYADQTVRYIGPSGTNDISAALAKWVRNGAGDSLVLNPT